MEIPLRHWRILYSGIPKRRNGCFHGEIKSHGNNDSYAMDTLTGKLQEMKRMMKHTIEKEKGRWFKTINEYMTELKLSWEDLENMDRATLKMIVKEYDTEKWIIGMTGKISLRHYIQEKKTIEYELCYRNNRNSIFLARARTNTLKLEDHKGRGLPGYDRTCRLCREGTEDTVHFIIDCRKLENFRDYNLINRNITNSEERMRTLLFRDERYQEIGKMIKKIWDERKNILDTHKNLQKKNLRDFTKKNNILPPRKRCESEPGLRRGGCNYLKQRHRSSTVGRG